MIHTIGGGGTGFEIDHQSDDSHTRENSSIFVERLSWLHHAIILHSLQVRIAHRTDLIMTPICTLSRSVHLAGLCSSVELCTIVVCSLYTAARYKKKREVFITLFTLPAMRSIVLRRTINGSPLPRENHCTCADRNCGKMTVRSPCQVLKALQRQQLGDDGCGDLLTPTQTL